MLSVATGLFFGSVKMCICCHYIDGLLVLTAPHPHPPSKAEVQPMVLCIIESTAFSIALRRSFTPGSGSHFWIALNQSCIRNIHVLHPSLANVVLNMYRLSPKLYINDEAIVSIGGMTQGDPRASSIYANVILPLILELENVTKQLWFDAAAAAAGRLQTMKQW